MLIWHAVANSLETTTKKYYKNKATNLAQKFKYKYTHKKKDFQNHTHKRKRKTILNLVTVTKQTEIMRE